MFYDLCAGIVANTQDAKNYEGYKLEMIRQLHEQLNIPTDVLIQAY